MRILVISRKWLGSDDFRELLRIADYIGDERGKGSIFEINVRKAISNGYTFDDVRRIIDNLGLEVEGSLDLLREEFSKYHRVDLEYNSALNEFILKIPWSVWGLIREEFKERFRDAIKFYGKDDRGLSYTVKPYKLFEIRKYLGSKSIEISDPYGVFMEKIIPYNFTFKGSLRDYQREALDAWINKGYMGVIALPTGSGKTVIAIAAIVRLRRRTLIVTYTKEQMFQWKEMILNFTDIDRRLVGYYYAEEKRLAPITITTYQSAHRNISLLGRYYDLLIIDECHHLPADKFRAIAVGSIAPFRMGLSATPVREDGRHVDLFPLLGGIIYYRSASELAEQGYLARYRIITVKVPLTPSELEEYHRLYRQYKVLSGGRSFTELLEDAKRGDKSAQEALRVHSKIRMLLANAENRLKKAAEIALNEVEDGSKVIIFTQYIEQAKELAKMLNSYILYGEMDSEKRRRILEEFRGAKRGILVVTTVGDEGIDIPDANVGIIVSGTGSRRQFVQRLGRILRPKVGEAKLYEIIVKGTPEEYISRRRKAILFEEFDFTGM